MNSVDLGMYRPAVYMKCLLYSWTDLNGSDHTCPSPRPLYQKMLVFYTDEDIYDILTAQKLYIGLYTDNKR